MKIEIEKIIIRGEKYVRIVSFSMLAKNELPLRFTADFSGYACWSSDNNKYLHYRNEGHTYPSSIFVGQCISIVDYKFILRILREAGKRLSQINSELHIENLEWHGKEITFIPMMYCNN